MSSSRRPSRAATPSRPTTSTTWSSCRPSSRPASRPSRRSSSRSPPAPASTPTRPCSATWRRARSQYAKELGYAIPIVLHLDHGDTFELCKDCIDSGFSSVMIDGSHHPYEKNVELTKKVVEYAHAHDVTVEGELGVLAGVEDEVSAEHSNYTQPERGRGLRQEDRRRLAGHLHRHLPRRHQVQARAVHPRRADGILIPPALRFDILEEIEKRIPGFPIVLHGSSSVPAEQGEADQHVRRQAQGRGRHPRVAAAPRRRLARSARSTSTPTAAWP